jgi:DNA-binding transcriptional MerR regulator
MNKKHRQLTIGEDDRFYTIGEVSAMLDVKAHVLYFWEKEFPKIRPSRGKNKRRRYKQPQIEAIKEIKHLLWEEQYTIKGAKQRLDDTAQGAERPRNTKETKKIIEQIETGINKALDLIDSESI